jgi:hypothetical protein
LVAGFTRPLPKAVTAAHRVPVTTIRIAGSIHVQARIRDQGQQRPIEVDNIPGTGRAV